MTLQIIIKIGLSIFLIVWTLLGVWLMMNFRKLFGHHPDDPAETPGARSFGVAHIIAVWIGGMALAIYNTISASKRLVKSQESAIQALTPVIK